MAWFIGVDQGSHSSRAVLFNDHGEILNTASQPVDLATHDNHAEHDAIQLLESVKTVIDQLLSALDTDEVSCIAACGIATQRSTVLAWDSSGRALTPALSWRDTRATDKLNLLYGKAQEIHRITGLPLAPYYSASKMRWLLDHQPDLSAYSAGDLRLSPLASYLLYNLVDEKPYVIDFSNAQRTQLFDVTLLDWSEQLCEWFGVDKKFLPASKPMCWQYGLLAGTEIPITAVCGDQNAAIYGAGDLDVSTALVNIGSGAFILRQLPGYIHSDAQLTGLAFANGGQVRYMREATVNGAGNALTWATIELGIHHTPEMLNEWLREVPDPPLFMNTVGGLGTPWMRDDVEPGFINDADFTDAERCVAILESIVFLIQVNLDLMTRELPVKRLRVSGGLSKLDGLCQKLASLSGLELERAETAEATARGVAWLAAGSPGSWTQVATTEVFYPLNDIELKNRYEHFQQKLNSLLEK